MRERPSPGAPGVAAGADVGARVAVGAAARAELERAADVRAWACEAESVTTLPPPPPPPYVSPPHAPPPPPSPHAPQPQQPSPPRLACRHCGKLAGSFHHKGGLASHEPTCLAQLAAVPEAPGRVSGAAATARAKKAACGGGGSVVGGGGSACGGGSAAANGGFGGGGGRVDMLWATVASRGPSSSRAAPRTGQAYQAAPPTHPDPNPNRHPNRLPDTNCHPNTNRHPNNTNTNRHPNTEPSPKH